MVSDAQAVTAMLARLTSWTETYERARIAAAKPGTWSVWHDIGTGLIRRKLEPGLRPFVYGVRCANGWEYRVAFSPETITAVRAGRR